MRVNSKVRVEECLHINTQICLQQRYQFRLPPLLSQQQFSMPGIENYNQSIQQLEPAELHTTTQIQQTIIIRNPIQKPTFLPLNLKDSYNQLKRKLNRINNSTFIISLLSRPLVLYKGAKRQISDVLAEVRGFTVNQRYVVLIQICNEILLSQENYADTASIVVSFINNDSRLQASLGKDAFILIFRDISNISKMAKDQRNQYNKARETI